MSNVQTKPREVRSLKKRLVGEILEAGFVTLSHDSGSTGVASGGTTEVRVRTLSVNFYQITLLFCLLEFHRTACSVCWRRTDDERLATLKNEMLTVARNIQNLLSSTQRLLNEFAVWKLQPIFFKK